MKWFRWYRGACENPKFAMIAEVADQSDNGGVVGSGEGNRLHGAVTVTDVICVYITVLEDAARVTHFGICTKDEKFIACVLRWWPEEVRLVLNTMVEFELLERLENGHYKVNKWEEYQYVSDSDPTNSERQKRYRNRHKTDGSHPHNSSVTRLDTDTDTDTDTEKKEPSLCSVDVSCEVSDDYPEGYQEAFWKLYPRKIGRKAAFLKLKTIRKTGEVTFARLMAGVKKIPMGEPKFIPHPTTWLNQGRWDDEDQQNVVPLKMEAWI
jgi:hypothetical protein